jgi:hypothetical protein
MALVMLKAAQVVKMLGQARYDRFLAEGLISPCYNADGMSNEPTYPEHLVTFRLQEDQRINGRPVVTKRQVVARARQQVRKSLIGSRVQKPPLRVYLHQDQEPGREVSSEVERCFNELLALARKVARDYSY